MLNQKKISAIKKTFNRKDQRIVLTLQAIQDLNRFRILKLLHHYQRLCVTDLANCLQISVPAVSQHLKILELSGFVKRKRHGKMICYQLKSSNTQNKKLLEFVLKLS